MKDIFKTKPHYINSQGTKFWLDTTSTDYAKLKKLRNVQVYCAENTAMEKTRIIVKDNELVYSNTDLEAIGAHLDIMSIK